LNVCYPVVRGISIPPEGYTHRVWKESNTIYYYYYSLNLFNKTVDKTQPLHVEIRMRYRLTTVCTL